MRKVLWYCTIAAVAGAATSSVVAEYTARHPHSVIGTCAIASYRLGTECNPLYHLGCRGIEGARLLAEGPATGRAAPVSMVPTLQMEATEPEVGACTRMGPDCETGDIASVGRPTRILIEEEARLAAMPREAGEESEEPARAMPLAPEDAVPVPARMPYADEDGAERQPHAGCPFFDQSFKPKYDILPGGEEIEDEGSAVPLSRKMPRSPIHLKIDPISGVPGIDPPAADSLEVRPGDVKSSRTQPTPF